MTGLGLLKKSEYINSTPQKALERKLKLFG
jgi:hypothetical protein